MSSLAQANRNDASLRTLPIEERRGLYAMWCVITTESALFASLFAAYFYLATNRDWWQAGQPPKLTLAFVMLALLLSSSVLLSWGERLDKQRRYGAGRLLLGATILVGLIFLVIQGFEYSDHWKTLTQFSDSYGSIFYTIPSFHAARVMFGLLMLSYVLILPRYAPARSLRSVRIRQLPCTGTLSTSSGYWLSSFCRFFPS